MGCWNLETRSINRCCVRTPRQRFGLFGFSQRSMKQKGVLRPASKQHVVDADEIPSCCRGDERERGIEIIGTAGRLKSSSVGIQQRQLADQGGAERLRLKLKRDPLVSSHINDKPIDLFCFCPRGEH